MLDKGQEDDWFGSHFILTLAVLAVVGLVSLVIWEWFYKHPIIEVRLFKNLNFLAANGMMFILGLMLFASLVMMPLFLQSLMGYTAESAAGAFRGWPAAAVHDARYRGALVESAGPLFDRVWLADPLGGDVLFQPASRP